MALQNVHVLEIRVSPLKERTNRHSNMFECPTGIGKIKETAESIPASLSSFLGGLRVLNRLQVAKNAVGWLFRVDWPG